MEAESRYEDIRCFNIYHSVSLKLQYPFKSQGTNYGAFGSHMTTLLVMQNSIAMTTGLVQTWKKKRKKTFSPHKLYWPQKISHQTAAIPAAFFYLFILSSTFLRKSV